MLFRERIIKDTVIYSVANYIAMGVGIIVSIVTKAILGPVASGYFALIKVFVAYGAFSDLGTRDAMFREVAQATGAGQEQTASKIRDCILFFTVLTASAVVFVFIGIAFWWIKDPTMKVGVILAGLLVFVTQLYNFSTTFMRLLKKISYLGLTIVFNIVGVAICSILGAYFFGVFGMVIGLVVITFFSAYFAYRINGIKLGLRWDPAEVLRLIKIGFPLLLASYAVDTFLCVDTLMIGKMIGYKELGYYTIALMSIQQINSLGRFSQIILLPHIQEKYGKTRNLADAKSLFVKSTTTLVYFLPVIIALVFFGVPLVVHCFLPKFNAGLVAMRILVTAYYFVAVNEMSGSILFTINKQARQIPIFAAMIVMAIGLNYLFIKTKGGIEGVALATTIAYFFYFAFFFYYAFKHLMEKPELHRNILTIVGIFIYMTLLLQGTEILCHLANPFLECAIKFSIFLLFFSPVLIYFEKKEGVFRTIFSICCNKYFVRVRKREC